MQRRGDKPGQLDAGTGAGIASSAPCGLTSGYDFVNNTGKIVTE